MLNLENPIKLSDEQNRIIKGFGVLKAEYWERNKTKLKKAIRQELAILQDNICVYCGCRIWDNGDVEHIADKARNPQFMFTPKNMALSCKFCNQTCKGRINVVSQLENEYEKCKFSIIHPYLDDVSKYFITDQPVIEIRRGLSAEDYERAKYTQSLFKWTESQVIEHRAEQCMLQQYEIEHNTSISQVAIENVLTYRPGRKQTVHT